MAFSLLTHYNKRSHLYHIIMHTRFLPILFLGLLISSVQAQTKSPKAISLAPHITELVFAAGGGDNLVGVSAYSNYPEHATELPVIGDAFRIDLEQMLALQPDLVFYWQGSTTNQVLQQLQHHQFKTVPITIVSLSDIGNALLSIAEHLDLPQPASHQQFMSRLNQYKQQTHPAYSVFLQLSFQPLYTVSAPHWMSEAAGLCGLDNIFQDLPTTAATVTQEAVIGRNPDFIIQMQPADDSNPLQQWPQITAIKQQHIIVVDPDTFSRPTPRILDAVDSICRQVNQLSTSAGE